MPTSGKLYFESMWSPASHRHRIITFRMEPGWFARLFGAKAKKVQFVGNYMSWMSYPDLRDCGVATESWLRRVEERAETIEEYTRKAEAKS